MTDKEKESVSKIISAYNFGKFNQHHISYYDLTEELGGHGDYKILLVKIEHEVEKERCVYYLFLDHKAFVKVWFLNHNMKIVEEIY